MAATTPADNVQPTESSAPAQEVEAASVDAGKNETEEGAQTADMDEQVIERMSWKNVKYFPS
jgi:hypothetical protein